MTGRLAAKERAFRVALGVCLLFVAFHIGLTSSGTEPFWLAWGALMLGGVALATAAIGSSRRLSRVGLGEDGSLGHLAVRLYVGWEFLYAGRDRATNSWHSGAGEVKGTLTGAIASLHATAKNPYPPVADFRLHVLRRARRRAQPEMVLLGMGVLLAPSSSVYALSLDRYLLRPVLHGV